MAVLSKVSKTPITLSVAARPQGCRANIQLRAQHPRGTHTTPSLNRCSARRRVSAAAAETTEAVGLTDSNAQVNWYAVVANADFMLHDVQNESFAEQLRERRRLFADKQQSVDFWLVSEPTWLEEDYPEQASRVKRPCVALVSTDEIWINFMKLRLDRVLRLDLGSRTLDYVSRSQGPAPSYEPLDRHGKWTAPYPPYRPGWWEVFMKQS